MSVVTVSAFQRVGDVPDREKAGDNEPRPMTNGARHHAGNVIVYLGAVTMTSFILISM